MKILMFANLMLYTVVVSQSCMYLLALKNTQAALGGSAYTELRQLIDANMNGVFKYVMYAALLISLLWAVVNVNAPMSLAFVTAAIAFVALLVDALLTIKGNVPLNATINTWSPSNYPGNWKEIRAAWFHVFQFRQLANITGFVSLLIGVVWGR